jgi:hypothetical protein
MAKSKDSKAQQRQERQNNARQGNEDKVPGIDKQLNGPNRPAE